ncbi:MAG: hypothetical protein A3F78_01815 [Burkholderiales bacterium RIFCSPLOWO2_12_FULL_61_40]|nr:MAG: hypothetical protein A3F78_01815 [Burkholderiales bacterium RIFCSPLOWO2_12_FULL_61_40]
MLRYIAPVLITFFTAAPAPAQAQSTERWSGNPVYTEQWSQATTQGAGDLQATQPGKLQEVAQGVGHTAGYMAHCGLDTTALQAAFDDLLARLNVAPDERARQVATRNAARAAARQQAAASGKVRQGACPSAVLDTVRKGHAQVIDSLGRITPEALAAAEGRPVTLSYGGQIANRAVGVSSTADLSLTFAGERLTGFLRTQPPLYATGPLSGRVVGDQCTLRGRMQEGFDIEVSGTCGAGRFDGSYTVMVNGQPQNGTFAMMRTAAAATSGAAPAAAGSGRTAVASSGASASDFSALPMVDGAKVPGRTEIRSGCDKRFASRSGPSVPIRWYGITETVTLIGQRTDGDLCALYKDGSSEWIAADRVMTAAQKQTHDQGMQALGAGLQRQSGGPEAALGNAHGMMDKQRETGNALHRETQEQYRQTERHYEDRRRQ